MYTGRKLSIELLIERVEVDKYLPSLKRENNKLFHIVYEKLIFDKFLFIAFFYAAPVSQTEKRQITDRV